MRRVGWKEPLCHVHNISSYMHEVGGMFMFHCCVFLTSFITPLNLFGVLTACGYLVIHEDLIRLVAQHYRRWMMKWAVSSQEVFNKRPRLSVSKFVTKK